MKRCHLPFLVLSLLCLMLAACGSTSSTKTTISASRTPTGTATAAQQIKIIIGDFYIHSPVTTFTAGTEYHFVITNVGTHYHNFLIMHPMNTTMTAVDMYKQSLVFTFNIAPNQTRSLNFTFEHTAPPGMLELSCHYGGHYEAGMYQPIVVKAAPGASVSPYPNNGVPGLANTQTGGTSITPCDPVITTQMVNGAYSPAKLSLKTGDTLTIVTTDGQPYTPVMVPDVGIRTTIGSPKNTTYLTFLIPSIFTLSSQEHPQATASISVSPTGGMTCELTPVTKVNFDASYIDPKNRYSFTPTQVTIKKGQSVTLSNLVDQNLTFVGTPDAGFGKVKILKDWEEDLKFTAEGVYTISCVEIPNKAFTVTVQGTGDGSS